MVLQNRNTNRLSEHFGSEQMGDTVKGKFLVIKNLGEWLRGTYYNPENLGETGFGK